MTNVITEVRINYRSSIFHTSDKEAETNPRCLLQRKTTVVYLGVQAHLGKLQLIKKKPMY